MQKETTEELLKKKIRILEWQLDKAVTGLGYMSNGWLKSIDEIRARGKRALGEVYGREKELDDIRMKLNG